MYKSKSYNNQKKDGFSTPQNLHATSSKKIYRGSHEHGDYGQLKKRIVSKTDALIKQAQRALNQPLPQPDFFMLTIFKEMNEIEKEQLTAPFRDHLNSKISELPKMEEALNCQFQIMTEEGSTRIDEVLEKWTPPPLRDREREIFVNKQNLLESCKELRKLYLKSIETSDFIRY